MKNHMKYFTKRSEVLSNQGVVRKKTKYTENNSYEGFSDSIIFCLNNKAKISFKKSYGIKELPDFVWMPRGNIKKDMFVDDPLIRFIDTTQYAKLEYVLFKFDKDSKPRILVDSQGKRKRPLYPSLYDTKTLYDKHGNFVAGILLPSTTS